MIHRTINDTAFPLAVTLKANGTAVDLSGCSVAFNMYHKNGAIKVSGGATTITSATAGQVKHTWIAGDVNEAGEFVPKFVVTFTDATTGTFPLSENIKIAAANA